MIIGIPKERKTLEKRIALTPQGAAEILKHGHKVIIESGAGLGSHFSDEQYATAGCEIAPGLKEVWTRADLVVKVKEPHKEEYQFFRPGLALFDYLHLASLPEVTQELLKAKVTGIAYELIQTPEKRLPLLEPMSEVAGKLSVLNGSYFLLSQNRGRGVLLGGTSNTAPAEVVILGAGIAGRAACEVAHGSGANVTVLDIVEQKLKLLKDQYAVRLTALPCNAPSLAQSVAKADLLIGAVLIPGAAPPKLVTKQMIASMKKGAVFVDISIDQGGCAETSKPTSLDQPVFEVDGVIHYGVCNMPAQTPLTSTLALTNATLPYILRLADLGIEKALQSDVLFKGALNTYQGKLTNKAVAQALGLQYSAV